MDVDIIESIKQRFQQADQNADGVIDRMELKELFKSMNEGFSDEEIDAMLAVVDRNGDGRVDYNEFVDWISGADNVADSGEPTREEDSVVLDGAQQIMAQAQKVAEEKQRQQELALQEKDAKLKATEDELRQLKEEVMKLRATAKHEGLKSVSTSQRPPCMAAPHEVTAFMRARQWRDPPQWTTTIREWRDIILHCVGQEAYKQCKKAKQFVSMYDINELFITPWTKDTGCGAAVLTSREKDQYAQLMLSHAWAEDAEELLEAVLKFADDNGVDLEATIWFCCFANYQAGDSHGPSIAKQLDMEPFKKVIESKEVKTATGGSGMLAVHTTKADLYTRLWCVHEVERAIKQQDLKVEAAVSEKYLDDQIKRVNVIKENKGSGQACLEAAGTTVNTIRARCGNPNDESMLVAQIMQNEGGFDELDKVIAGFRRDMLPQSLIVDLILNADLDPEDAGEAAHTKIPVFVAGVLVKKIQLTTVPDCMDMSSALLPSFASYLARGRSGFKPPPHLAVDVAPNAPEEIAVAAAQALGDLAEIGPENVAQGVAKVLVDFLEDGAERVRNAALEAFLKLDGHARVVSKPAAERLAKRLSPSECPDVRCSAAAALGQLDLASVKPFAKALGDISAEDPVDGVREAAVKTLWRLDLETLRFDVFAREVLKTPSGLAMLSKVPKHIDARQELLPEIGSTLKQRLSLKESKSVELAAEALGKLAILGPADVKEKAAQTLAELLGEDDVILKVFSELGEHARASAEIAAPELQELLTHPKNDDSLCIAAVALRQLGPDYIRPCAPRLVDLASTDPLERVRRAAVETLSQLDVQGCTLDVGVLLLLHKFKIPDHFYLVHGRLPDLVDKLEQGQAEDAALALKDLELQVAPQTRDVTQQASGILQKWSDRIHLCDADDTRASTAQILRKFTERVAREMRDVSDYASLPKSVAKRLQNPNATLHPKDQLDILLEAIRAGSAHADMVKGQHLVMLLGNTGAGKSTFANYLQGCKMEEKQLPGGTLAFEVSAGENVTNSPMKIGHTNKSYTFLPQVQLQKASGLALCDCPGFYDNRGPEISIANVVNIKTMAATAASVRIIVLVNYHSLHADRGRGVREILDFLTPFFENHRQVQRAASSIMLGVSRCPLTIESKEHTLEQVHAVINRDAGLSEVDAETLKSLTGSNLFIFHPLDKGGESWRKREQLLEAIQNLETISDPTDLFHAVISPDGEQVLRNIVEFFQAQMHQFMIDAAYDGVVDSLALLRRLRVLGNSHVDSILDDAEHEVGRSLQGSFNQAMALLLQESWTEAGSLLNEFVQAVNALGKELGSIDLGKMKERALIHLEEEAVKKALEEAAREPDEEAAKKAAEEVARKAKEEEEAATEALEEAAPETEEEGALNIGQLVSVSRRKGVTEGKAAKRTAKKAGLKTTLEAELEALERAREEIAQEAKQRQSWKRAAEEPAQEAKRGISDFEIGQRVVLSKLLGTVRFHGTATFASGIWIGVELDEPRGKNDGSIRGTSYFKCRPNHGIFVRSGMLKPLHDAPRPAPESMADLMANSS